MLESVVSNDSCQVTEDKTYDFHLSQELKEALLWM